MKVFSIISMMLVVSAITLAAQDQAKVKTIEVSTPALELIPLGSEGFIMFEYQARNLNEQQMGLTVYGYDLQLNESWSNMLSVSKGMQLRHYQVIDGKLFMVFSAPGNRQLQIFTIYIDNGHYQVGTYQFSNAFFPGILQASGPRLWVSGTMMNQGVVFELDTKGNTYRILPTAHANKVGAIRGLHFSAEDQVLSYLLQTTVERRRAYVFRSLGVENNRVLYDIPLLPAQSFQLDQVELIDDGNREYITGTFYKKNPEQTIGIFQFIIEQGAVVAENLLPFKEIEGFYDHTVISDDPGSAKSTRKESMQALVDEIIFVGGVLLISIEMTQKQYQPKGALQQEFEQSQLVNMLDQDQSGRRSFDQASDQVGVSQSAEDRIYQGSATDILRYRYRNAIVNQPMYQGYAYQRSVLFTCETNLTDITCKNIRPSNTAVNFMAVTNTFQTPDGIRQVYDKGGLAFTWLYHPETHQFSSSEQKSYLDGTGRLFHLYDQQYLAAQIQKDGKKYLLNLQKVTF